MKRLVPILLLASAALADTLRIQWAQPGRVPAYWRVDINATPAAVVPVANATPEGTPGQYDAVMPVTPGRVTGGVHVRMLACDVQGCSTPSNEVVVATATQTDTPIPTATPSLVAPNILGLTLNGTPIATVVLP